MQNALNTVGPSKKVRAAPFGFAELHLYIDIDIRYRYRYKI